MCFLSLLRVFSSYAQVLDYLYSTLPMYQRIGTVAFKKDLTNTLALCEALGNPHRAFRSVHIAGTNGKGSTAHMLAAILQQAGYKTGLYTSPHLKSFTERIRINGAEVSKDFVTGWVVKFHPHLEFIHPSFFETTVAMAFHYFAQQQVDIAVVEVGLGGRLDSTNVITPLVSVITNISYDHMDMLGDTLEKIAAEKAGIIKPHVPAVIGARHPETDAVFIQTAGRQQAPLYFAPDEYEVAGTTGNLDVFRQGQPIISRLALSLKGDYQKKNIPAVLKTIDLLKEKNFNITDDALRSGLENTVSLTGLKGRWQTLTHNPLTVCDVAHNEDGIREVVKLIRQQAYGRLFMVLGMVADKQHDKILSQLPRQAMYIFCQANIPRALPAAELANKAAAYGLTGEVVPDVNQALNRARTLARPEDFIFVGGSTFVVAELNDL